MKKVVIIFLALVCGLTSFCGSAARAAQQKVLYIDSYHPDYLPNVLARKTFADGISDLNIEVRYEYMDAKNKKSADLQRIEALRVKEVIEQWQPDLIVAADDSVNKYLIAPYYKNSSIPIIFNGVNWDASAYGYPASNVTGQIEIELILELISRLQIFSHGKRLGILTGDTLTDRKSIKLYSEILHLNFDRIALVNNFAEWKNQFLSMQKSVDILIMRNNSGISGWDNDAAQEFTNKSTAIPTGCVSNHLNIFSLICYPKKNEEFGEISSKMVRNILHQGKSPADIPIVTNKKSRIYLNMKLAKKLKVTFPMELIENAHLISAEQKKLLYINSYHKGYKWSDDIEKGLLKALHISSHPDGTFETTASEVQLRLFRMNSKLNTTEVFKEQAALAAKKIIDEWQPDIVVTSDDAAAKYLIAPYYKNATIPFVFSGLNWNASVYGFPTPNITGIIEIAPVTETVAILKEYAKGDRIGLIGANNLSTQKTLDSYVKQLGITLHDYNLVATFAEWQKEYLRLQDSVDMILWLNPFGIKGWDSQLANEFILANTKIPTGGTSDDHVRFALLGVVGIAEEQGWWAGKTALKILGGTKPADIPVTTNKESKIHLNMELAKRLKIKFPLELIEKATSLDNLPN